jgi:hypothetical protein
MDWNAVWTTSWSALNSPAVIAALAAATLWALNKLYAEKPAWRDFEGTIISAVKAAEKAIPDETPNKGWRRLNHALDYVLEVYQKARGMRPDAKTEAELKEGIQVMHAELEAAGTLDKPEPEAD